jgi:hypothetical protein
MPQSVSVIAFDAVTLSLASPTCNDDHDDNEATDEANVNRMAQTNSLEQVSKAGTGSHKAHPTALRQTSCAALVAGTTSRAPWAPASAAAAMPC